MKHFKIDYTHDEYVHHARQRHDSEIIFGLCALAGLVAVILWLT